MENPLRIDRVLSTINQLVREDLTDQFNEGLITPANIPFNRVFVLPTLVGLKLWLQFLLLSRRDRSLLIHRLKREVLIIDHPCGFRNNRITVTIKIRISYVSIISYDTEFKEFR